MVLLFGNKKIKMARKPGKKQGKSGRVYRGRLKIARKPGKKQKENPVRCTGECKTWDIREGSREGKTGTVLESQIIITLFVLQGLYLVSRHSYRYKNRFITFRNCIIDLVTQLDTFLS